jgi:hypothetical protein
MTVSGSEMTRGLRARSESAIQRIVDQPSALLLLPSRSGNRYVSIFVERRQLWLPTLGPH